MTKPEVMTTLRSEPTLLDVLNRLSSMRQEKTYRPDLPWWALFTDKQLADIGLRSTNADPNG